MILLVFFSIAYAITQYTFPSRRSFIIFMAVLTLSEEGRVLSLSVVVVTVCLFMVEIIRYIQKEIYGDRTHSRGNVLR